MSRIPLTFECQGVKCVGTLDTAPGLTGLLIVNGGNEIRSGAFQGQSRLAARIAKAGFPVFRFDRRGTGDSDGENRGFRKSRKDILAAIEAFQATTPQMTRIVAFGNCDAASALMLASGAGCDRLILANPWTFEDGAVEQTPDAVRTRYLAKLAKRGEWKRLLTGGVNLRKLAKGLVAAAKPAAPPSALTDEMRAGLAEFGGSYKFLIAGRDRTGLAFEKSWRGDEQRIARCEGASHGFVEAEAAQWLEEKLLGALRKTD